MQPYRFLDQFEHLRPGLTHSNAPGEIWHIRAKTVLVFFYDHRKFHEPILLHTRLFQDTTERAGWDLDAGLTSDCYRPLLLWMLKLPVASPGPDQNPAVLP